MPVIPSNSIYDIYGNPAAAAARRGAIGQAPTTAGTTVPTTPYTSLLSQYNQVSQPTDGQGPYGKVPGTTPLPPSIYSQATAADPGLFGNNDRLNANIMSELNGELSPQVLANLQNTAASYGVRSGMPGSNARPGSIVFNKALLDNIQTTQDRQARGLRDYQSQASLVGSQQLNPALIAEINQHNAELAAAPDPAQAAQRQLDNYYAALNAAKGPGGGTGGPGRNPAGGTGLGEGAGALGFGFNSFGQSTNADPNAGRFAPPPVKNPGTSTLTMSPYSSVDQSNTINDLFNSDLGFGGNSYTSSGVPTDTVTSPVDTSQSSSWDFTDPSNWDAFYAGG